MLDWQIKKKLRSARRCGTVTPFAVNRAKEGVDIRPLLDKTELAQVDKAVETYIRHHREKRAEARRKQEEHEAWLATLPETGVKVADLARENNGRQVNTSLSFETSLSALYYNLRRYGISTHKVKNRRWITREDADRYQFLCRCLTRTEWSRRDRSIIPGSQPVGRRRTGWGQLVDLYSESQTRPKRRQRPAVAYSVETPETLLAAIFSVNRSAKRYRDAASLCYEACNHLGAAAHSRTKQRLYRLKDAGVVWAVRKGWLTPVAQHKSVTVYRGEGYCFHSVLCPSGWAPTKIINDEPYVEQQARSATEIPLKDAVATLRELPTESNGFERAEFPPLVRHSGCE